MSTQFRRGLSRWAPALICAAAIASSACGIDFSSGQEARDQWKRSYPLAQDGLLDIRGTNGTMRIEAVESDRIEVVADRIVRAPTADAAKDLLDKFEIREEVSGDRVVIDSTLRGLTLGTGINRRVDFVVRVPRYANVTLQSTNGSIEVSGVGGRFRAVSTNGGIRGVGLGRGAEVETTNGAVTLEFVGLGDGVRVNGTNGGIDVSLPRDASAEVSLRTSNGGLSVDGFTLEVAEQSRRRLDGSLGDGGPPVRLETTNGGIRVRAQ